MLIWPTDFQSEKAQEVSHTNQSRRYISGGEGVEGYQYQVEYFLNFSRLYPRKGACNTLPLNQSSNTVTNHLNCCSGLYQSGVRLFFVGFFNFIFYFLIFLFFFNYRLQDYQRHCPVFIKGMMHTLHYISLITNLFVSSDP